MSNKQVFLVKSESGDYYREKRECDINFTEPEEDNPLNWSIDFNQQARDVKKGVMLQFVTERSKNPVQMFKDRPVKASKSTDEIFFQHVEECMSEKGYEERKNSMLLWFAIVAIIFAVVISLVILMNMD